MAFRELGRQGRLFVGLHTLYGDDPTPVATDAVRHIQFLASNDPTNRRNSPEKKFGPAHAIRFTGREIASVRQLTTLIRPSGVLNTLPEADLIFEAAFGAKRNVTLATTVNAGTGAVGGATLASAAGLAVHDFVLITCPDGQKRARRLTAADTGTGVVTWAPELPAAPADGAAVKAGLTYRITEANILALWAAHYHTKTDASAGFKRLVKGIAVDRVSMTFDANEEPQVTFSGPAQRILTGGSVPAQPGAFTSVGGNPPSGITGELYIGNTEYDFLRMTVELVNNLILRNDEYGTAFASASYRRGRLEASVGIDARCEDESVVYDLAEAGTNVGVFKQTGFTEGNIIAVSLPTVEFKVPDTDDPDEEVNWPFRGMALESAVDQNDAIFFALL